jgi:hypothetical protein
MSEESQPHIITNRDIHLIMDALDAYRKSEQMTLSEIFDVANLTSKLMQWMDEVNIGVQLYRETGSGTSVDDTGISPLGK